MKIMLNQILRNLMKRQEDTGWVSLPLSGYHMNWTLGTITARRIGDLVEFSVYNIRSEDIVQQKESRLVDALPECFRPHQKIVVPFVAIPSPGNRMGGLLRINPNGLVTIEPMAGETYVPSYGIHAQVTYFIN